MLESTLIVPVQRTEKDGRPARHKQTAGQDTQLRDRIFWSKSPRPASAKKSLPVQLKNLTKKFCSVYKIVVMYT